MSTSRGAGSELPCRLLVRVDTTGLRRYCYYIRDLVASSDLLWMLRHVPRRTSQTSQKDQICTYIHRIMSAGWGFPVWAAAALIRAIRLGLTE